MSRDFNPRASGSKIRLRFGCPGTLVQGKQPAETVMRRITSFSISAAVYASLWVVTTSASWGQDLKEAEVLNTKVIELYNAGQYAEALPLAQRALSIREKELGPDDPDLASSLENLAASYRCRGITIQFGVFIRGLGSLRARHTTVRTINSNFG